MANKFLRWIVLIIIEREQWCHNRRVLVWLFCWQMMDKTVLQLFLSTTWEYGCKTDTPSSGSLSISLAPQESISFPAVLLTDLQGFDPGIITATWLLTHFSFAMTDKGSQTGHCLINTSTSMSCRHKSGKVDTTTQTAKGYESSYLSETHLCMKTNV